jgi:hypothetical protein
VLKREQVVLAEADSFAGLSHSLVKYVIRIQTNAKNLSSPFSRMDHIKSGIQRAK